MVDRQMIILFQEQNRLLPHLSQTPNCLLNFQKQLLWRKLSNSELRPRRKVGILNIHPTFKSFLSIVITKLQHWFLLSQKTKLRETLIRQSHTQLLSVNISNHNQIIFVQLQITESKKFKTFQRVLSYQNQIIRIGSKLIIKET